MIEKILSLILSILILVGCITTAVSASDEGIGDSLIDGGEEMSSEIVNLEIDVKSAVLMEAKTGTIIYSVNGEDELAPASVTKIMTLLLVAEALDNGAFKLDDEVSVSGNAASMGGSQIFLEEGECFTVDELIKCTVIASANDAAVALAELVSGSESAFVAKMNDRADELGMKNTNFENCTGLDDSTTNHVTSAQDIAIMSRELIKYPIILKYSGLWQDTIRDGEFTLTNTNRLVRYYKGCTGLKTGSTDKAGYCVSTTAMRDGMHLIAVVMGSPTRDSRNNAARAMLDYGFSTYALLDKAEEMLETIPLKHSTNESVDAYTSPFTALIKKADIKRIETKYDIPESLSAPVKSEEAIGKVVYELDGNVIGESSIYVKEDCEAISPLGIMLRLLFYMIR